MSTTMTGKAYREATEGDKKTMIKTVILPYVTQMVVDKKTAPEITDLIVGITPERAEELKNSIHSVTLDGDDFDRNEAAM
jgi:hypothetical protein